ncbi:MAG: DUF2752 domain-containing protein [Nocardioidaceae bacterium]|nr:DUF2752 domain-containing protein [Nocardioidaceae bacterium]
MTLAGHAPATVATSGRWQRLSTPLITTGALATATLALRLRDPHDAGSWGFCPSQVLFGVSCPGCGGLRAVNDLTHGDVVGAASSNLLLVLAAPVVAWVLATWIVGAWQGRSLTPRWVQSPIVLSVWLAGIVVFTVVRNLPVGAWLAP